LKFDIDVIKNVYQILSLHFYFLYRLSIACLQPEVQAHITR